LAEYVRAFCHEVHATENDVSGVCGGSLLGEAEGISREIGEFDDFVTLVVMAQNHNFLAQLVARGSNAFVKRMVRQKQIAFRATCDSGLKLRNADRSRLSARGLSDVDQRFHVWLYPLRPQFTPGCKSESVFRVYAPLDALPYDEVLQSNMTGGT
jgi:hypothetical protein